MEFWQSKKVGTLTGKGIEGIGSFHLKILNLGGLGTSCVNLNLRIYLNMCGQAKQ